MDKMDVYTKRSYSVNVIQLVDLENAAPNRIVHLDIKNPRGKKRISLGWDVQLTLQQSSLSFQAWNLAHSI